MLIEIYRGWKIYYSPDPRPLWSATRGIDGDIYTYDSLETLKGYIDKKIMKDALNKG